ncbi:hypothetical protein NLJ89_g4989 [Agrocybe chaxingu]|uniref:F-box domain-containing protein n=1 Tax=Agrocybe chaxingu TaxID=84603 RepID=A0A9W8K8Y2_9AGAR|nr:hypothetical protein NLJ89_g4989 [Agrocybe chaxingu]
MITARASIDQLTMETRPNPSTDTLVIPPPPDISPILTLLISNDPPEPQEEAIAHQIIETSTKRILECDELIKVLDTPTGQLNEGLASVKSRRAEYVSYIRLHKNVVGIIRRVPSDILLEIFFEIVRNGWRHDIWSVLEVCRRWRDIALDTPTLWSTFRYDEHARFNTTLSRLSRSLKYARSLPLQLSIGDYCRKVRELVFPHSKQIIHLEVSLPLKMRSTFCFPSTTALVQWDLLRSLKLRGLQIDSRQISVFQRSPLLQDVEVTTKMGSVLSHIDELALPWSQLCKFSGDRLALGYALSILQAAPMLEECDFVLASDHPHFNLPPFCHRSLSRLHIRPEDQQIAQNFLNRLILPSLKKLSVDICVLDLQIVSDFIKRSSCKLTFLSLLEAYTDLSSPSYRYPASAIHHLLSLVPNVIDLCLPFSVAFVQTTLTSIPSLVPQLRHLYLECANSDPTTAEPAIRDVALAVARGDLSTLETLILDSWDVPLSDMIYTSSDEAIYEELLDQWFDKLWEVSLAFKPRYQRCSTTPDIDLDRTLSLIESRQDIPPLYLCQDVRFVS